MAKKFDQPTGHEAVELTAEEARQATGPSTMLIVLMVSLLLAVLLGAGLLYYFFTAASPTPALPR